MKQLEFVCLAQNMSNRVNVMVLDGGKIVNRKNPENHTEAIKWLRREYGHDLVIKECFENYEEWHEARKSA